MVKMFRPPHGARHEQTGTFAASAYRLATTLVGQKDITQRVCGSLQAGIEKTRRLLGWTPPFTLDEGSKKTAKGPVRETTV